MDEKADIKSFEFTYAVKKRKFDEDIKLNVKRHIVISKLVQND
jgi:hypothetical protein